jgi:predicted solute-binding protein
MGNNLQVIADRRELMGLTSDEVTDYLEAFRYVLSEEDWKAIEEFERAWRSLSSAKEATI